MTDKHCLFAVADADPARSICETFRAEFNAARKAQFEWVKRQAPHADSAALKQGHSSRIGIFHADLDRKLWTNPDKKGCQFPRASAKALMKGAMRVSRRYLVTLTLSQRTSSATPHSRAQSNRVAPQRRVSVHQASEEAVFEQLPLTHPPRLIQPNILKR